MVVIVKVHDMFEESDIQKAQKIIEEFGGNVGDIDELEDNVVDFYVNLGGLSELSEFKKKMYASELRVIA